MVSLSSSVFPEESTSSRLSMSTHSCCNTWNSNKTAFLDKERLELIIFAREHSHIFSSGVELQSQFQSLLSLLGTDAKLFPHSVEARKSVPRWACCTAQRLAEDHCCLQQLAAIIIGALKTHREISWASSVLLSKYVSNSFAWKYAWKCYSQ